MNQRVSLLLCGLLLASNSALAQFALPGAAPPAAPDAAPAAPPGAPAPAPKPKRTAHRASGAGGAAQASKTTAAEPATIDGRPLLLNGQSGLLQLSGAGKTLQVDKLRLAGESVSDSSQKCIVDIAGEKPIEAASVGRPDGLERFEVDVPACPFAFDVLDGAVLVPPQITACVFKAADCQTSPGGLWGPDADSLKDAAAIAKQRSLAEKRMGKALEALAARAKDNPDAAGLVRDQNAFAGERDEQCRGYVKETALGFCAASLTEARAALLESRLEALSGAAKPDKEQKAQKTGSEKKKKKPKGEAAAQPAQAEPPPAPSEQAPAPAR